MAEIEFNRSEAGKGGDIRFVLLQHLQVFFLGLVELPIRVISVRLRHERHGAWRQFLNRSLAAFAISRGRGGFRLLE